MIITGKIKSHHRNRMVSKWLLWWIVHWQANQQEGESFLGTQILCIKQEHTKNTRVIAVKNPPPCATVWKRARFILIGLLASLLRAITDLSTSPCPGSPTAPAQVCLAHSTRSLCVSGLFILFAAGLTLIALWGHPKYFQEKTSFHENGSNSSGILDHRQRIWTHPNQISSGFCNELSESACVHSCCSTRLALSLDQQGCLGKASCALLAANQGLISLPHPFSFFISL